MKRWIFYKFYPDIERYHEMEMAHLGEQVYMLSAALRRIKLVLSRSFETERRLRQVLSCVEKDISPRMIQEAEEFLRKPLDPND